MIGFTLKRVAPIFVVSLGLLGGCASAPYSEAEFGSSVRQMVRAQQLYPAAAAHPSTTPLSGVDGPLAESVLDQYRSDVGKPQQIHEEMQMDVDQGQ